MQNAFHSSPKTPTHRAVKYIPNRNSNTPLIAMNSLRMIGAAVGGRAKFAEMLSAIERHKIKPVVDHIFPLTELGKALAWLKNSKHVGKVCVEID
jgi:D-arabinose 1-dehydrogenase-like Zn-dependent alcohol dehydrogenase